MGPQILKRFYSCTIESILTGCITAWYGKCSASDRKTPQRVGRTAQYITGAKLPAIHDLYTRLYQRIALKYLSHPSHRLFNLLVEHRDNLILVFPEDIPPHQLSANLNLTSLDNTRTYLDLQQRKGGVWVAL